MKKTPFEDNQSIRDLLNSIVSETKIDSLFASHKSCLFFLDIESYSLINKYFEFIFWAIFFLIMDFIIFMQSFPSNFFTALNKSVENGTYNSPKFIETRLSIQQASILINITIFFFVIYQWYKFFTYKSTKHLSHETATFLHFTIMYFPTIMTPILGSFFGANIITNEGFKSRDGILLSIYVLVSTILLLINHLIYSYFVNYSLSLRNSFFAYWNSPFHTIDLIYFFAVSLLFTFRSGRFDVYTTISGILGIIYGIYSIYTLKYTLFVFSTGKFCLLKIFLDSILFGIFTLVSIWTNISFISSSITAFLLFFITGIISYLIIGPLNEKLNSVISVNNFLSGSSYKIRNAEEALFTLRNAATFSIAAISDPNFIQFIVKNRFSSELVTDVVRLSIYAGFDLSSIIIPRVVLSPFDILPLKYMTFQYKLFKNMIKSDKLNLEKESHNKEPQKSDEKNDKPENYINIINNDNINNNANQKIDNNNDPIISDVCHRLQQEKARAEEILETFWTENDSKQLNIYQLGNAIHEISYQFSMYGSIFKQCESIQSLWRSFSIDVLAMPSAQKNEPNILNMFVYKTKGLLTYLIDSSQQKKPSKSVSNHSQNSLKSNNKADSSNELSESNNNNNNNIPLQSAMLNDSDHHRSSNLKLHNDNINNSSVSVLFNSASPDISTTDFSEIDHQPIVIKNRSHFFNDWSNNVKKRPEKTELEKYFKTFQKKNIRPILILFIVITVLICLSGIVFGVNSNEQTRNALEEIVNVFDMMLMGLTISSKLVSSFDNFTAYPNIDFISTILGISEDEARLYRSQKILPCEFDINVYDKLEYIPIHYKNLFVLENCSSISYSLLSNYKLPEESSISSRKCYFYSILLFLEHIKDTTYSKISTHHINQKLMITDYLILIIFLSIFIIIFIVFYFVFDRRMHKLFLKAVAHISCSGSNKNFTERSDFSFNFFVQFLNFLALLGCIALMYYGHSLPINSLINKSSVFSNITYSLGLISIRIQETMASILLEVMKNPVDFINFPSPQISEMSMFRLEKNNISPDYAHRIPPSPYFSSISENLFPENMTNLIFNTSVTRIDTADLITLLSREIIYWVNFLTFSKGFPQNFNSIPLLDIWINKNGLSYGTLINDWATFGMENISKFDLGSYKFLYMRYIYINTLASFIQNSYPESVNSCFVEMTKNAFSDWEITILTVILSFCLLSLYFCIHKRKKIWFYGASLLLRRRITKDQRFIVSLRQILENGKIPEFLDLLPFAAVVKDKNDIIIDSNWRVQKFTKLTTRQLVGQNFNDIFYKKRMLKINPKDIEITELKNTKNDQDLIVLRENFGLENIKESLNQIIERFNFPFDFDIGYNSQSKSQMSKNNLIVFKEAVFIEVKLENGAFKPEESFSLFNSIEDSFNNSSNKKDEKNDNDNEGWKIQRLACGAMFYTALCYFNESQAIKVENDENFINKKKRIFQFIADFSNKTFQSSAIVAVTMGKISCFSLAQESNPKVNLDVIAAGNPVMRAHELCLYGTMGRTYVDFDLINFTQISKDDINFLFIARQEKKKKRVTFLLDDNNQIPTNVNDNDNNNINDNDNHFDDNDNDNDHRPVFYDLPEWVLAIMPV